MSHSCPTLEVERQAGGAGECTDLPWVFLPDKKYHHYLHCNRLDLTNLGSLQSLLSDEVDDFVLLHLRHEHPAAPGHQGEGSVLGQVGAGTDDVFPDAASDQPPECLDSVWVGAGMVEQHHGPVLDIVKPPLCRHELVLSELGPDWSVVAVGGDGVGVGDGRVHTEMLWEVTLG